MVTAREMAMVMAKWDEMGVEGGNYLIDIFKQEGLCRELVIEHGHSFLWPKHNLNSIPTR